MNYSRRNHERGAALVTAIIAAAVVILLIELYGLVSYHGYQNTQRDLDLTEARLLSEDGIYLAMSELKENVDTQGNGIGRVRERRANGSGVYAEATDLAGGIFRIKSNARVRTATFSSEALIKLTIVPPSELNNYLRGAITARGNVQTLGSISIDGRDWNETGTALVGAGVPGVSATGLVTAGGSSTIGGNGLAPSQPPPPAVYEALAQWPEGYPSGPDAVLGLAPGTLRDAAQKSGTYFSSQAALSAYISSHGGSLPGGIVLYVDFNLWQPVELNMAASGLPSIIVHHNDTGTAVMKNLHGLVKGLVLADYVEHLNGDFILLGALMSFASEAYGNIFGNGNAHVKYSSATLGNLPSVTPSANTVKVLCWNRAAVDEAVIANLPSALAP